MYSSTRNNAYLTSGVKCMLNFSVFKVNLDGSLSNRENLSHNELDGYVSSVYGKFATIKVIASNGKEITYTDNGKIYEQV